MISQDSANRQAIFECMAAAARQGTAARMRAVVVMAMAAVFALALSAVTAHATTYTVNTLQDTSGNRDCSLRDAINAAEGSPTSGVNLPTTSSGNDTIKFSVSGTITLGSLLAIFNNGAGQSLTINGSGQNIIISGNNEVVPLAIVGFPSAITLNLQNLTIANGNESFADGGTAALTISAAR